jgi:hypothetical protein
MKKIKSIALALAFIIAGATNAHAQTENHTHKAAHGGVVQEAGNYHIEMVTGANMISFYLLDAKGKTVVNNAISGTAVFDFFNKTKATSPVTKADKNAFQVATPKANIFTYCTVSFMVKGKSITAKFKNNAVSQSDIEHGHQH